MAADANQSAAKKLSNEQVQRARAANLSAANALVGAATAASVAGPLLTQLQALGVLGEEVQLPWPDEVVSGKPLPMGELLARGLRELLCGDAAAPLTIKPLAQILNAADQRVSLTSARMQLGGLAAGSAALARLLDAAVEVVNACTAADSPLAPALGAAKAVLAQAEGAFASPGGQQHIESARSALLSLEGKMGAAVGKPIATMLLCRLNEERRSARLPELLTQLQELGVLGEEVQLPRPDEVVSGKRLPMGELLARGLRELLCGDAAGPLTIAALAQILNAADQRVSLTCAELQLGGQAAGGAALARLLEAAVEVVNACTAADSPLAPALGAAKAVLAQAEGAFATPGGQQHIESARSALLSLEGKVGAAVGKPIATMLLCRLNEELRSARLPELLTQLQELGVLGEEVQLPRPDEVVGSGKRLPMGELLARGLRELLCGDAAAPLTNAALAQIVAADDQRVSFTCARMQLGGQAVGGAALAGLLEAAVEVVDACTAADSPLAPALGAAKAALVVEKSRGRVDAKSDELLPRADELALLCTPLDALGGGSGGIIAEEVAKVLRRREGELRLQSFLQEGGYLNAARLGRAMGARLQQLWAVAGLEGTGKTTQLLRITAENMPDASQVHIPEAGCNLGGLMALLHLLTDNPKMPTYASALMHAMARGQNSESLSSTCLVASATAIGHIEDTLCKLRQLFDSGFDGADWPPTSAQFLSLVLHADTSLERAVAGFLAKCAEEEGEANECARLRAQDTQSSRHRPLGSEPPLPPADWAEPLPPAVDFRTISQDGHKGLMQVSVAWRDAPDRAEFARAMRAFLQESVDEIKRWKALPETTQRRRPVMWRDLIVWRDMHPSDPGKHYRMTLADHAPKLKESERFAERADEVRDEVHVALGRLMREVRKLCGRLELLLYFGSSEAGGTGGGRAHVDGAKRSILRIVPGLASLAPSEEARAADSRSLRFYPKGQLQGASEDKLRNPEAHGVMPTLQLAQAPPTATLDATGPLAEAAALMEGTATHMHRGDNGQYAVLKLLLNLDERNNLTEQEIFQKLGLHLYVGPAAGARLPREAERLSASSARGDEGSRAPHQQSARSPAAESSSGAAVEMQTDESQPKRRARVEEDAAIMQELHTSLQCKPSMPGQDMRELFDKMSLR